MKDVYQQLWEAFSDIYFEEVPHKYTDSYGTKYTSVTTFVSQLEVEKDWDLIAEKAIKKKDSQYKGMTVEQVRAAWKASGDYACQLGTYVHSVMELGWQNKEFYPDENVLAKYPGMKEDFEYRKQRMKQLFMIVTGSYVERLTFSVIISIRNVFRSLTGRQTRNGISIIGIKNSKLRSI